MACFILWTELLPPGQEHHTVRPREMLQSQIYPQAICLQGCARHIGSRIIRPTVLLPLLKELSLQMGSTPSRISRACKIRCQHHSSPTDGTVLQKLRRHDHRFLRAMQHPPNTSKLKQNIHLRPVFPDLVCLNSTPTKSLSRAILGNKYLSSSLKFRVLHSSSTQANSIPLPPRTPLIWKTTIGPHNKNSRQPSIQAQVRITDLSSVYP